MSHFEGLCECGCRREVKPGRRFIHGHSGSKGFSLEANAKRMKTRAAQRELLNEPNPSGLCMCGCGQPAPIAQQTSKRRGWVQGKPIRFLKGHHARKSGVAYVVNPETGCWEWQLGKNKEDGYGRIKIDGRHVLAHRYYYEQKYGPIPDGMFGCHTCDNPGCVNPDHVYPGTREENTADMMNRGRHWAQKRRAAEVAA